MIDSANILITHLAGPAQQILWRSWPSQVMFRPRSGRFLRPAIYTIAAAGLGSSGYWLYSNHLSSSLSSKPSFDIRIRQRSPDGRTTMTTKSISQLSDIEIESLLTANAKTESITRPYGVTWKHSTASLNSNDPIEDANAQLILRQNPKGTGKSSPGLGTSGDLLFFAIMDGHAGPHTSRLLAKALIPAVALELSMLDKPSPEGENIGSPIQSKASYLSATLSYLRSLLPFLQSPFAHIPSEDPKYFQLAIQTAFANLDSEIVNAPVRVLEMLQAKAETMKPWEHPMAEASLLPALSGSCALLAVLDTARRDLHVAVTGDSRAVAGYWDEDATGEGKWRVEVLTEDQTGRNINEYKR
jgi:pyruvate dehydrogenase phosphatase